MTELTSRSPFAAQMRPFGSLQTAIGGNREQRVVSRAELANY
jgi:hypothetical protein